MCLIVFAFKNHPRFDLIFAANRDEFYGRPTRAAQFWDDHPTMLAGKDLSGGGTWMGINRRGQFAALTNFRDPSISKENAPSRGEIVINYLNQNKKPTAFLQQLKSQSAKYMGFNMLAGTPAGVMHYSNQENTINTVEAGVHGLSNHLLQSPWPKLVRLRETLGDLLNVTGPDQVAGLHESLIEKLQDETQAPDHCLPDTGVGLETERFLSAPFIRSQEYGTRATTVVTVDIEGTVTVTEQNWERGGDQGQRQQFSWQRS